MKFLLSIILIFFTFFLHAQDDNTNDEIGRYNYYFVGLKLCAPSYDQYERNVYNFMEVAFGKITNERFSFQVKLGSDNYKASYVGKVYVGSYVNGQIVNTYLADGLFVKPGWIFIKRLRKTYTNYLSVNLNMTYTKHTLQITTIDPVYGDKNDYYIKNTILPFSSFEIEHVNVINIGTKADINLSYYLGFRTAYPKLFGDILQDFDKKANFIPGVTTGGFMYVNILVGVNIHLY
jgi:hypothetical protein